MLICPFYIVAQEEAAEAWRRQQQEEAEAARRLEEQTFRYQSGDKYVGEYTSHNVKKEDIFTSLSKGKEGGHTEASASSPTTASLKTTTSSVKRLLVIPDGYGEYTWRNGQTLYEGDWRDGMMHGRGTFYWQEIEGDETSGGSWCGTFAMDELHGRGVYTYPVKDARKRGKRREAYVPPLCSSSRPVLQLSRFQPGTHQQDAQ